MSLATQLRAQCRIQGKITDKSGKSIILSTAVLLNKTDSNIIATAEADSAGNYSISCAGLRDILLKATAPGYTAQTIRVAETNTRFDFVLDENTKALASVTITAQKPLIEHKADRIIYNVESSVAADGSDAYDLLKKVPGVTVSKDVIGIAGKSSVMVMINEKTVEIDGEELAAVLKSIGSDNISRIEVITTPPAKYDAEGNSGIINIITKKAIDDGLSGNITAGYRQNSMGAPFTEGAFNYKKGSWDVYGNGNIMNTNWKPVEQYTAFYPTERLEQKNNITNQFPWGRCQLGIDYKLNKNSTIGLLYTYGTSDPQSNELIKAAFYNKYNVIDSIVSTGAHTNESGRRNVLNLNYEWRIDSSGKKLNVAADYFTRKGRKTRDFTTTDNYGDGSATGIASIDRSIGTQVVDIESIKADMEWPTALANISFGGKASMVHNTSDNTFKYLEGSEYITDPGKTNQFDYKENTQALYLSAKRTYKAWELQAGLRGEYTQTTGYSPTMGQSNVNNYFKLFPTVYIQYAASEDHSFRISYSKRIDRPDFWLLNPFRYYSTTNSYTEGNPFLQPSYNNNIELSYTLKSNYTFTLYTQIQDNVYTQVLQVDTINSGLYFRMANVGKSVNYGFTSNGRFEPTNWWESNVQLTAYYGTFSSAYYNELQASKYSKSSFSISVNNSIFLNENKTLLAEVNFVYQANQQSAFDMEYAAGNLDMGIKAMFFNKRLIVALETADILATDRTQLKNLYNQSLTNNYEDERELRFSLSYKFGKRHGTDEEREQKVSEEEKRAK
ncbi:MAG: TonB-dependent receptor [Bacteroidetes bacterium]|nr:TonB-dependent receptor [Bacteroidota bacterium]